MQATDPLFRPFTLKGRTLKNRIVMAPMTRSKSPAGQPGADVAAYYRRRAEGGTGLIICEATTIDHPVSKNDPDVPDFHGPALDGWRHIVDEIHAGGAAVWPQLWHTGTMRRAERMANAEVPSASPSGFAKPGVKVSPPLTDSAIADIIAAYAKGAADAQRLGFDGVEIHGAHGYLIDQFFWAEINHRKDCWGGDFDRRAAFGAAVVRACREAVGPDFPICIRISQWKQQDYDYKVAPSPELLERWTGLLADAGADIFHCSQRRFWEPEFEGSSLNFAGWTKKVSGKPVITVGSVSLDQEFIATFREGAGAGDAHIGRLLAMLEDGEVDLVAVGRALIANPDWPAIARDGRWHDLKPYAPALLAELV